MTACHWPCVTSNRPILKPWLIVTRVCGPSQAARSGSHEGLPITKAPAGMSARTGAGANRQGSATTPWFTSCRSSGASRLVARKIMLVGSSVAGMWKVKVAVSRWLPNTRVKLPGSTPSHWTPAIEVPSPWSTSSRYWSGRARLGERPLDPRWAMTVAWNVPLPNGSQTLSLISGPNSRRNDAAGATPGPASAKTARPAYRQGEIRNPKAEIRRKSEGRNRKAGAKTAGPACGTRER